MEKQPSSSDWKRAISPPKHHKSESSPRETILHLHFYEQKGGLGILVIFYFFLISISGPKLGKTGGSLASNGLKLFDHKM